MYSRNCISQSSLDSQSTDEGDSERKLFDCKIRLTFEQGQLDGRRRESCEYLSYDQIYLKKK